MADEYSKGVAELKAHMAEVRAVLCCAALRWAGLGWAVWAAAAFAEWQLFCTAELSPTTFQPFPQPPPPKPIHP